MALLSESLMIPAPFTANVKQEISTHANKNEIGFAEEHPVQEAEVVKEEPEQEKQEQKKEAVQPKPAKAPF